MLCIIFPRIVDHTSTRARAHTQHTHTYTHCGRTTKGDTLFTINSETPKETTVSRKTNKKKESSKESALPFTKRERYGDIYTLHGKRDEKKEREREREKIKKKREEKAHRMNIESRTPQILTNQSMSNWVDY